MGLLYSFQPRQQGREQRRAPPEIREEHVLVERVRTIPLRAEAV
jgi:hypothetical protein